SAAGVALFALPTGTTTYQMTAIARVLVAGGILEAVGDSASDSVISTWKLVGGVASVVPPVLSAPTSAQDASMAGTFFGPSAVAGAQASVPYVLPALDAGTTVQITIALTPLLNG